MSQERYALNKQLAQMLKGGVIMDVTTPEQAKIAEEAGACAVMALERIPADIRAAGGVSRMSDPKMIKGIQEAVSIPVMAKCRIGHFVEAQILEAIEIDYIDESEVLSPADDVYHIDKRSFKVPFVCGAKDLGEALRRIAEGASMIRTKGEPGTGDVVQAVRHMRMMNSEIAKVVSMREDELFEEAKNLRVPYQLVEYVHKNGRLPGIKPALLSDAIATSAGAVLGTSTTTTFVESSAGVASGGRTGLTSLTTAVLFLISMFFAPIFVAIPSFATAPALIMVGFLMFSNVTQLKFDSKNYTSVIPAYLCIIAMPLFYSISEGISIGVISYVVINLVCGKRKEIKPIIYVLAVLFILKYIFL